MSTPANRALDATHASKNQFAKFNKNHPDEYSSLFANLAKIQGLLRGGHKVGGFHVNFFRSEGDGVYRIGQTGVPGALESRLYVYPDNHIANPARPRNRRKIRPAGRHKERQKEGSGNPKTETGG